VTRYHAFCVGRGWDPSPQAVSAATAAEYLAALGTEGKLCARTIGVHRSALSTWRLQRTLSDDANPLLSVAVERVLKGIARERQAIEAQRRAVRPTTIDVTPALLASIQQYLAPAFPRGHVPHEEMRWAAANVATYALLRPSELLGSPQHPDRALLASQITFYMTESDDHVGALRPPHSDPSAGRQPDHFTIALGPSKADQQGLNPPIAVAARPAVHALWVWMHRRRDLCPRDDEPQLFRMPGKPPMRISELMDAIADACVQSGRPRPHLSGRAFRRGGASSLMAGGAARPDIRAAGRWRSESMPEVYASRQAKAERALAASRAMAPRS
jgi:hypothetical protein